jgi:hypothetical protein
VAGAQRDGLPAITLDLDGVICAPLFGLNIGISRDFLDPDAPPRPAVVPPRWYAWAFDHARFDLRRPAPDAREALAELRALRRVVVLTGRRTSPRHWLRWHGLDGLVDDVVINDTPLRSAHFKLQRVAELGAAEHMDDDGRTVELLARRSSLRAVYLRDWPRNRGPAYSSEVVRIASLSALVRRIREADAASGSARP